MARWVRNRNRRSSIKWLIRDGSRLFATPDHFIEYHDKLVGKIVTGVLLNEFIEV